MTLYNFRSDGTITKWDSDGNVEASYSVSEEACTCPAGFRASCRHRQMLRDLIPIADSHWFYCFDRKIIVDIFGTSKRTFDAMAPARHQEETEQDTAPLPPTEEPKQWPQSPSPPTFRRRI